MHACSVTSVVSDSLQPHRLVLQTPHPWSFPGKKTGVSCHAGNLPHPGTDPASPALHSPTEPPGKSLNIVYSVYILMQKEMASHSCILAWEISWTEEPEGLQSTEAPQALLSMRFPRQGYRSGLPFPSALECIHCIQY